MIRLIPPKGPKYRHLADFLTSQPVNVKRVRLGFGEIIGIISNELPKSSYLYAAWWANDASHVQAAAWLRAGWIAANVDVVGRYVEFERTSKSI